MLELANRNYLPVEKADSPFYWMSQFVMRSASQHLKSIERNILGSASVTAPHDTRSVWISSSAQMANIVTMGVNLEADDKTQAMIKASGLTLLTMRRAGADIEDLTLEDGRLASGAILVAAVA